MSDSGPKGLTWTKEPSRVVRIHDGLSTFSTTVPEGVELEQAMEDFLSGWDYSYPDQEDVPDDLELFCQFQVGGEIIEEFYHTIDRPDKQEVPPEGWETVAHYVELQWDGNRSEEVAIDQEAQIGTPGGPLHPWYVRTYDPEEDEEDQADETVYPTREAAAMAARALAEELHVAEPRETAAEYNRRKSLEVVKPDPEGPWCLYWASPDGKPGSGPRARYATQELAERALEIARGDPVSLPGFKGTSPLDGFEVRELVRGEWVPSG